MKLIPQQAALENLMNLLAQQSGIEKCFLVRLIPNSVSSSSEADVDAGCRTVRRLVEALHRDRLLARRHSHPPTLLRIHGPLHRLFRPLRRARPTFSRLATRRSCPAPLPLSAPRPLTFPQSGRRQSSRFTGKKGARSIGEPAGGERGVRAAQGEAEDGHESCEVGHAERTRGGRQGGVVLPGQFAFELGVHHA